MAATSQPLSTQAAIDILKAGGTAVDAAIAANAVLGLVEPTGGGIGGDLFAIVWDEKSGKLYGLNGSGRSPYSLTIDYFRNNSIAWIPSRGPLSVSVPGCVDGWFELHKRPFPTIIPGFITKNGQPFLSFGVKKGRTGCRFLTILPFTFRSCITKLHIRFSGSSKFRKSAPSNLLFK